MFKKLGSFLLIIVAFYSIYIGGNYIYTKQLNQINYNSFSISNNSKTIYIPNAQQFFNTKNINKHLSTYLLPESLVTLLFKISTVKNFNSQISKSIYLSFDSTNFSLVLKNKKLTSTIINNLLIKKAKFSQNQFTFNDITYFYQKTDPYFVISTLKINPKKSLNYKISKGHYIYSYNLNDSLTYYTNINNVISSFTNSVTPPIYGNSTIIHKYFKIIPDDFSELHFYGSSKPNKDLNNLINSKDSSNFFDWVDDSFIHIKKDSLELIIGYQNNFINLKNNLDEQTLFKSKDSLLPATIFKNNFEISFFNSAYNWKKILPNTQSSFKIYTELNNYNILANSTHAIDWFIKANQLGNSFKIKASKLNIPKKVHFTKITQQNDTIRLTTKNWISQKKCITTKLTNNFSINNLSNNIKLISNFNINQSKTHHLISYTQKDTLFILDYNDKTINCYNILGKNIWNKKLTDPLIQPPKIITFKNNTKGIVLTFKNYIDVLTNQNVSISGFPFKTNSPILTAKIIQYKKNGPYRLLIALPNKIINLNLNAKFIEGWTNPALPNSIKSKLYYSLINNKDYIYYKDNIDSIHVFDRKGNNRYTKSCYSHSKNESPHLAGNLNDDLKVLSYNNGYIKSVFIKNHHHDSVKLSGNTNANTVIWTKINNTVKLILEDYQQLKIYNEFGFLDNQIQKPQPNLTYLNQNKNSINLFVFGNLKKNELYLLNSFGKQINKKPILGNKINTTIDHYFIVYYNSQLWIYNIK